jgi:hypothetical protein
MFVQTLIAFAFVFVSCLTCVAAKAATKSASIHHGFDPSFLSDLSVNRHNTFHDKRYISSDAPSVVGSIVKSDPPMTLVAHHFSRDNQCSDSAPVVTGTLCCLVQISSPPHSPLFPLSPIVLLLLFSALRFSFIV